ncbi:Pyruvate/2-oxoglutarate dehydrogenase complex, dihydrolipoamide dehydrogenase (E3) component, and related enzyme [Hahella chejuensis KCTC 2396]|uniref:Soluble pyridine nucleotide transhydrogenase n=1 Tax=Hahella chejuensis (strain KCTC 2396) TaxID=349521 RepID=Q2SKE2_HAHCH|nr:Si-specific NAD(P)(+) transhydrogenase [Hahella chejuensis]ABC28882.1 Pyruvate/2-oxoglutarate dehydrogenase complex, dihydrolipoamide dehydrogenase (E3) component, and related enzyme [Hahella chejuensis KCTC 2396]
MSDFDIVVIGSGPAGQKAAVQAAKAGKQVALIERDALLGGACVHRGTIPSKTLRENALRVNNMRKNATLFQFKLSEDLEMATLIDRLDDVMKSHDEYMRRQIDRNAIKRIHGRARFLSPNEVEVTSVRGKKQVLNTDYVVIATGSFPRKPEQVPIDHENIFDSDSVLSMLYLPKSLAVLGGGVIASEYASIFQALGVRVIMIDRYPRPLGFLDKDLTDNFVNAFQDMGGVWMGNSVVKKVCFDGVNDVITELEDGRTIITQKLLCAAGREANVKDLDIDNAGLALDERGVIPVDGQLRTRVPNIFAAGDVIGPPSLASASMEQGRRAACNVIGLEVGSMPEMIPVGIYGVPELSSVGMTEQEARKAHGQIIVGRAPFSEIARGHISGNQDGMLKLVCDAEGRRLLGVQIVGEEATELIHIGQMALLSKSDVDIFVESIFNFPTLAEAYRVAALAVIGQRARRNSVY